MKSIARLGQRSSRLVTVLSLFAALTFIGVSPALAQTPIVVGQSCDMSGPSSTRVKEYAIGVDAYIASLNTQGGVNGRPIKLVRYDDAFKPEKTLENAKKLVEQDGAVVFFGMGSAPSTAAILSYATEKRIPIFGSLSGADSLRKLHPLLFHFRASFGDEIARIATHLQTMGMKRLAVIASDLPIGKDGLAAIEISARQNGLEIVKIAQITQDHKNLDEGVAAIAGVEPQAVLILAPAGPGIKFTEALKKKGVRAQLFGLSVMSSDSLYQALGDQTRGMIITQVVPFPWSPKYAIAKDYQKLMAEAKIPISIDGMEGYMSARLLSEGLKAAGTQLTGASFVKALESMKNKDIGGLVVTLSPEDHVATNWVEITMIGANGKLIN